MSLAHLRFNSPLLLYNSYNTHTHTSTLIHSRHFLLFWCWCGCSCFPFSFFDSPRQFLNFLRSCQHFSHLCCVFVYSSLRSPFPCSSHPSRYGHVCVSVCPCVCIWRIRNVCHIFTWPAGNKNSDCDWDWDNRPPPATDRPHCLWRLPWSRNFFSYLALFAAVCLPLFHLLLKRANCFYNPQARLLLLQLYLHIHLLWHLNL